MDDFGYSYIKIRGKGNFLKSIHGGYEIVQFQQLRDCFTDYLEHSLGPTTIPAGISHNDFMNEYYRSNPITLIYAKSFFQTKNKLDENDFILEGRFLKFK